MYKNIIVGFDDSEFSKLALAESALWVKNHGGKILLVHAVFFNEEEFVTAAEQLEKRYELGKKMCLLAHETTSAKYNLNGNLDSIICEGEPHEVLVDVADAKKADLIALGTHGRKGLKKLFLGSVTSRVIVSSPCDVLVVNKQRADFKGKYGSILLSYDGSEFSKRALIRSCEMARLDGSDITALYVIPQEEMPEFFITESMKNTLKKEAEKIMEGAKKLAADNSITIKTEVMEGNEAERLVETASRLKSDLIIRGPHGWTGLNKAVMGSIIENVIIHAPCPVLTIK
jgi:nucleotide-binding universal stress UspA family protein